jgi:parallel beta-helix repeat protein
MGREPPFRFAVKKDCTSMTASLTIAPAIFSLKETHVKNHSIPVVLLVFTAASLSQAATIHVPGDQPTIQAGINAAVTGDTVLVDSGIYFENINFNGKAITVSSANGPHVTIIDGGHVAPVATFSQGETPTAELKGFTLQHGTSTFQTSYDGGGVYISSSSPTILGNIIQDNTACDGGGGIAVEFGSPRIQNNMIVNNTQAGCSGGIGGAGISVGGVGTTLIIGNLISDNAWTSGDGGGISLFASGAVTIEDNIITGNSASGVFPAASGGGISMVNDSPAIIVQNLIYDNSADQGAGIYFLVPSGSQGPRLVNNTIADNTITQQGSAVYAAGFDDHVQFFNNLMIGQRGQSALYCDGAYSSQPPAVTNSDAFSPRGMGFSGTCAQLATLNGNISADPKFIDNVSNFELKPTSPAIDAGTNSVPHLPHKDLSRQPRIVDGDGNGTAAIDMGAYEFQ